MNNNKNKAVKAILGVLAVGGVSQQVMAELYVSPVVQGTVRFDSQRGPAKGQIEIEEASRSISGESTVHGEFLMREQEEVAAPTMRFGKNVPLFVALTKIVPNASDWVINIDSGLENKAVNWKGGATWRDVLMVISKQNNLTIRVNEEEHAIGVSENPQLAMHMAKKVPEVWPISERLSLKQNLEVWAKQAGWSLEWDPKLNIDYPISHGAVLTGKFLGEGGVVDRLLYSMRDTSRPLRAKFHTQNKVLYITEAGYRQEVIQ